MYKKTSDGIDSGNEFFAWLRNAGDCGGNKATGRDGADRGDRAVSRTGDHRGKGTVNRGRADSRTEDWRKVVRGSDR